MEIVEKDMRKKDYNKSWQRKRQSGGVAARNGKLLPAGKTHCVPYFRMRRDDDL